MPRIMPFAAAATLLMLSTAAYADQMSGKVERIDVATNMVTIGDKTFQWSSENSMGIKLDQLKVGEQVKVDYQPNSDGTNDVVDIRKAE